MEGVKTDDGSEQGDESELTFTIEEAIEKIGFGKFQVKILTMIGFAWMADSLEMALLAILAPAVRCEWNLSHWHEAFLTTVVFIGMFSSTYFWGYCSDNFGRRKVLLMATFGVFLFGLLSAFSINYGMILTLRGVVGLAMGGIVQGTTLIVEYLPQKARGLTVNFGSVFWSAGASVEILLAMFVMPRYGWRYLLFVSAWPCLLFVVAALLTKYPPESVRFMILKERVNEAMDLLTNAARVNKKSLPEGELVEKALDKHCDHGSLKGMFQNGYWKLTILLWTIWFASHFNIYGLALFTTALFSSSYKCYIDPHEFVQEMPHDTCILLTEKDYLHFFYVLAADFPVLLTSCGDDYYDEVSKYEVTSGYFYFVNLRSQSEYRKIRTRNNSVFGLFSCTVIITALLADTVGRKWLQAIGFFAMGFFFALLFICTQSRGWATFFLFGVRCFAAVADIGGYIYTPEVYPTHIRGMALGSCSGISRLGCMLTPFVSQVLTHHSLNLTISIYFSLSMIGGICCLLLPIETKGKGLEQISEDMRRLTNSQSNESNSNRKQPDVLD